MNEETREGTKVRRRLNPLDFVRTRGERKSIPEWVIWRAGGEGDIKTVERRRRGDLGYATHIVGLKGGGNKVINNKQKRRHWRTWDVWAEDALRRKGGQGGVEGSGRTSENDVKSAKFEKNVKPDHQKLA